MYNLNYLSEQILSPIIVRRRIYIIVSKNSGVPVNQIKDSSRFEEDLKMDELNIAETILTIEKDFNIKISKRGTFKVLKYEKSVKTVGSLINHTISAIKNR